MLLSIIKKIFASNHHRDEFRAAYGSPTNVEAVLIDRQVIQTAYNLRSHENMKGGR